eukprot:gnl/TRDRNA2_/TRDRNA2_168866_c0_seq4.p1 gnl/TRDRNA2_/TRDRNA2_168866_c0~~gnl/TRDRNA2_/TRDRNA2_168866_c0_seq4.p1  ORF type:complete len:151 (+),score=18.72 gnl/TRDRNA2_/TRDRNA2_168866_c0_seq4:586-1038(+)
MWYQRSGKWFVTPGLAYWDYHVIAVLDARTRRGDGKAWVLDLDSTLGFPCEFDNYFALAFKPEFHVLDRSFRVIPREEFLHNFRSDRSHMLYRKRLKYTRTKYKSPPPPEPPIGDGGTNLFADFVSMDANAGYGTVLSQQQFYERFSSIV